MSVEWQELLCGDCDKHIAYSPGIVWAYIVCDECMRKEGEPSDEACE